LLVVFPDEPIQAQRFNKISKALGTRTPRQVASRVQKYFIKLAKMGLPVPGRFSIPSKKSGRITKPSAPSLRTSGAGYNSLLSGGITNTRISGAHYTTSHGPPAAFMSDDEDMNVKEMMRTVNTKLEANDLVIHEGYACDGCGTEPIVGVRYKCTVCDVSEQVDLCGQCMEKGTFTNDHHTLDHPFEAVRTAQPFPYYADHDYKSPEHLGEYSYLGF
ncbi:ZZ-type zinc finger-containing protein 3, partial [Rhizopus stolonifer]